MSTNTNKTTIDIELDGTEIVPTYPTDITVTNNQCVEIENPESIISGSKKEYSIVGDGLYASVNTDQAPEWLTSIIDDVVDGAVSRGLTDYNSLVQDVRDAIDSIDVAANTYVEQVNINSLIDGIVVSKLETLNATLGSTYATIVGLQAAIATSEEASATYARDLFVEYEGEADSRITQVEQAYASGDIALANDISSLNSRINSQESDLEGTADAVSGLQTYVGLTDFNNPNGTGMLSRLGILEKQNDGVIEYTVSTVDPMSGVDPDDTTPDNNQLLTNLEPYVSWASEDATLETEETRAAHIGDVYIVYSDDDNGVRTYIKSYKFIKTAVDGSSPFSTDTEGYTWALITDTDAQSAYVIALNAQDLADSKRRVFTQEPFAPYDVGDLWVDNSVSPQIVKTATVASTSTYSASHWVQADQQAQDFITNTYTPDSNQIHRQLDGKIEYYFYESSTDLIDPETGEGALSESIALDVIASPWTTQATRDNENGNVVYFKDTRNAYWYQASANEWAAITDTSIYEALQDASTAQGAADGKVSQFYAWGGEEAPADYVMNPSDPAAEQVTIAGASFLYWLKADGNLYYKPVSDWVVVPTSSGGSVYLAEGDVLTVYDPVNRDISSYSFNGTSWQQTGPTGIISQSKFFVDLENDVNGPNGSVASALSTLQTTTEAYANDQVTGAKSTFLYDSQLELNGVYYKSGFGLDSSLTQPAGADGTTPETAFESEFWINAERFKFTNSNKTGTVAPFTIDASGTTPQITFNGVVSFTNVGDRPTNTTGDGAPEGTAIDGSTYIQTDTDPNTVWVYNSGWKITGDPAAVTAAAEAAEDAQTAADNAYTLADGKISASDLGASGTTVIDGGRITTGIVNADLIGTGSIYASSLGTATLPANYTGTIMDSKGIRVYDTGVLRVKLGDLT